MQFLPRGGNYEPLYFCCKYSKSVWKIILNWFGYYRTFQNWTIEKDWIRKETCKKVGRGSFSKVQLLKLLILFRKRAMSTFSMEDNWILI